METKYVKMNNNQKELSRIYNKSLDLNRIVEDYNSIVRKTKLYAKEISQEDFKK